MAVEQIDPGTLEGDALKRWYLRSPADIEQQRQEAAAQRYKEFFGDSAGVDSNPTFDPRTHKGDEGVRSAGAEPSSPHPPTYVYNGGQSQIAYGALSAPAPSDQELAELRRQQATFANTARQIDIHNSWLAIPALAPVAAVLGLEGAAAVAGRALAGESVEGPLNFVDREAWQRGA